MKPRKTILSGDKVRLENQPAVDAIMSQIEQLYRDRLRAYYNNDESSLQTITQQIDQLRSKLTQR